MIRLHNIRMAALLLIVAGAVGCTPTGPGMPERKKLPGDESYLLIPLPDAANDSATMSMINSYKHLAIPLLTQWAAQQQRGIMIDLRANERQPPMRAAFRVQQENAFSFPVVFLWDYQSAARAAAYINELSAFKAVNVSRVGGSTIEHGFGNCFHP